MSVVVIFRGDEVLASGNTDDQFAWNRSISPGECVVVNCQLEIVGGQQGIRFGVTQVEAWQAAVSQPAKFYDLCSMKTSRPKGISFKALLVQSLTDDQRAITIAKINQEASYLWDNATLEVKLALGAQISNEDKARELMRQSEEQFSQGNLPEAVKLVQAGLEAVPGLRGARALLGKIAIEAGKVDEAIEWFKQEAAQANPGFILTAYRNLEAIYRAKGDEARAQMYARAAMNTQDYRTQPSFLDPGLTQKIRSIMDGTWKPRTTNVKQSSRTYRKKKWWEFWK